MGKVKKVVIDTNIFISGFGWDGKPEEILKLLENRRIKNIISPEIFEELKRVVSYPKLNFSESLQNKILEFVFVYSELVVPAKHYHVIQEDSEDNMFLDCAIESKAEFIISGDPHLINLAKYKSVKILTARAFLKLLFFC